MQHSTWLGVTGTVALAVGLYLIALGAWGLRSRVVPILIGLAVLVALVWLCTPSGRETVFGKDDDDPGWLSVTVEPWLRDSWWAPIAVLVGFFAVSGLWALVTKPRRRTTSKSNSQPEQSAVRYACHLDTHSVRSGSPATVAT